MVSAWPEYSRREWNFAEEEEAVEMMKEAVRAIRTCSYCHECTRRARRLLVYVVSEDAKSKKTYLNIVRYSLQHLVMQMRF